MENLNEIKAAYALNLWTVSVSQIIDYNDVNIMKQEYDNIMNNLNLENMPKDEALLDIIKEIMDEITNFQIDEGDLKFVEREYQHKLKNAVWSAVPNVGAIFATANPVAIGLTLATQVGIGYMNYRRNKSDYEIGKDKEKWQIQKNRMLHLNALKKQLFETAWRLADSYKFKDEYRITESQIHEYNEALMEENVSKRLNRLENMKTSFEAYPTFWYQLGSSANSIYRSDLYKNDAEMMEYYKKKAVDAFEIYWNMQGQDQFSLLRNDIIAASCALEYIELMDFHKDNEKEKALKYIHQAERFAGNANDVLELCAFAYLRAGDNDEASRIFHKLVNDDYNDIINTQILSGLYIKQIYEDNDSLRVEAKIKYKELKNITDPKNILPLPPEGTDLEKWSPAWNKKLTYDEFLEKKNIENNKKKNALEERKKKVKVFYQKPTIIVHKKEDAETAAYFATIINSMKQNFEEILPPATKCTYEDYKTKELEFSERNARIIFLGDSDESKATKRANHDAWDYEEFGIQYASTADRISIVLGKLDEYNMTGLYELATEYNSRYGNIYVDDNPLDLISLQQIKDGLKETATGLGKAAYIATSPFFAVANGFNKSTNKHRRKEINNTRYSIAFYKYLESEDAIWK